MPAETTKDITGLLADWGKGDDEALKGLMPIVYPHLRRIARRYLAQQLRDHTLESAALVNEAYLKLLHSHDIRCESRVQFFALCAQIIRRILVDYARKRKSAKRGGGAVQIPIDETLLGSSKPGIEVVALDEALTSLSKMDSRKGKVVELRYFGGLSVDEVAEVLGISQKTTKRDWQIAKAWLLRELKGGKAASVRPRHLFDSCFEHD